MCDGGARLRAHLWDHVGGWGLHRGSTFGQKIHHSLSALQGVALQTGSEVFMLYSLKWSLQCHYNFLRELYEIKAFRESSFSSILRNVYLSLGLHLIAMLWDIQLFSNKNAVNPTIILLLLYELFSGTNCEISELEAEQSKFGLHRLQLIGLSLVFVFPVSHHHRITMTGVCGPLSQC